MVATIRVLVLGAHGTLGSHVLRAFDGYPCDVVAQGDERFHSSVAVSDYLAFVKPAAIVNCIGYLGHEAALHCLTNGCLPRVIADWCGTNHAFFLHVSTNAVFTPDESRFWLPADPIDPHTPYEVSKAFGEDPRAYVVRSSFVGFSPKGTSLLDRLVRGEPFRDRKWNGVTAASLSRRIRNIVIASGGVPANHIEHYHSPRAVKVSDVARLIGSASKPIEYKMDARLLGGGVPIPAIDVQLEEYLANRHHA